MIHLQESQAKTLIANKTVAVVGNAQSIFSFRRGWFIDTHEVVIRFNAGIPTKSSEYPIFGKRTDILAGFKFIQSQWLLAGKPPIFYRGAYDTNRKPAHHRKWAGVVEWRAAKHREDCISKYLNKDKGPSNGVMLLEVLVNLFKPKLIRLFGFDFFSTLSWYPTSRGQIGGGKYHDGEGEAYYIKEILGFKLESPGIYLWENI